MTGPLFRDNDDLLSDTDDILKMIRSTIYTIDDFKRSDFELAKSQLSRMCSSFKVDTNAISCLIAITVNNLVISGCTMDKERVLDGVKFFTSSLFCSRGSSTSQKYLLDDMERYALVNEALYLEISIPAKTLIEHVTLGFLPVDVSGYKNLFGLGKVGIREAIHKANTTDLNPDATIVVTKSLREDISSYLPTYDSGLVTVPRSIGDNVSRFSGMIEIKRSDMVDYMNHPTFTKPEILGPLCKEIGIDYIKGLGKERGKNYILTIEVSGVLLSFCIVSFSGISDNDLKTFFDKKRKRDNVSNYRPYAYIDLICSMGHAYLGTYMFRQAELFALRNGVFTLRLTSVHNKIGWYTKRGMSVNKNYHDNDPDSIGDHTPLFADAIEKISKDILSMESGIKLAPIPVEKETRNRGSCSGMLMRIIVQIFGKDVTKKFNTMYPGRITIVSNRLSEKGACQMAADPSTCDEDYEFDSELDVILDAGIGMSKKISY